MKLRDFINVKTSINFANRIFQRRKELEPAQTVDPLFAEIQRIEKKLAGTLKRPASNRVRSKPVGPLAEYQIIVDLAG